MDRMDQLEELAGDFLKEKFSESQEVAGKYYRVHKKEVVRELACAIQAGLEKCEAREKGVKYIVISMLESSILLKTYELQIAFLDDKIYLDTEPVYNYWSPSFLFAQVDDDMGAFRKKASQTVIRIRDDEMAQIARKYVVNHYFVRRRTV